jgi:trimeric autotransporter adhesin
MVLPPDKTPPSVSFILSQRAIYNVNNLTLNPCKWFDSIHELLRQKPHKQIRLKVKRELVTMYNPHRPSFRSTGRHPVFFQGPASLTASPRVIAISLFVFLLMGALCGTIHAQGTLTNGVNQLGTIVANTTNSYTFTASAGDTIELRIGATNFNPVIKLFGPDGTLAGSAGVGNTGFRDAVFSVTATNSGTFTVTVSSFFAGGTGGYALRLAHIPAAIFVSSGDQGGALTNGVETPGTIDVGDLDMWSFTANAGDSIELRMGAVNLNPWIQLYGPDGKLVSSAGSGATGVRDAVLSITATNSGTFTVVVSAFALNQTGTYNLNLAKIPGAFATAPGDDGGTLTNGIETPGTIDVGDLDMWSFTANAGDSIELRMGAVNLNPSIQLYGPDGKLVSSAGSGATGIRDAVLSISATNSGTFTVVVSAVALNQTGTYNLNLAKVPGAFATAPGDDGGTLTNGAAIHGMIDLGDLDMWTFNANSGDSLILRMGAVNFNPSIQLYGPNGKLVGSAGTGVTGNRDTTLFITATNSGLFTVVASAFDLNQSGTYLLNLARIPGDFIVSPGDEGGALSDGASQNGSITVGDEDLWTFDACKGFNFTLMCQKLTGTFTPRIRLFNRNGALLATAQNASIATLNYVATNSGSFTALVDGAGSGDAGTYSFTAIGIHEAGLNLCAPFISGTSLDLGGYGGTSNATFILLTTTNITTPTGQWTPILTNQFDQFGALEYINQFNGGEHQRYFRLLEP